MANSTISVPIRTDLFLALADFYRRKGSDRDLVEVIETAIGYWMDNADWKEEDLMPELNEHPLHVGYFWKPLLLPSGTKIRMTYKSQTYHAAIVGDDFVGPDDRRMSASEFANSVAGGTARNAWRDLWIKRPHDPDFRLADELRRTAKSETLR